MRVMCRETVNRSNGRERQTKTEKMREEKPSAYWELKKEWEREKYIC
jgi:hypothetical protein